VLGADPTSAAATIRLGAVPEAAIPMAICSRTRSGIGGSFRVILEILGRKEVNYHHDSPSPYLSI